MKRSVRGAVVVGLLSLISSVFVVPIGLGSSGVAGAVSAGFSISTNPPLDPPFNPGISDYAVRCTSSPSTKLTTTGSGRAKIGGTTFRGPVNLILPLVAGQEVKITQAGTRYYIRCLPSDFPSYSSVVTGTPQANGYLLGIGNYAVVFDSKGVPVWWYDDPDTVWDAKFMSGSTIAWWDATNSYQIRTLRGALTRTVGGDSVPLDLHDLQQLPNGNYLAIMDVTTNCPAVPSQCVDLSSWGLSPHSSITDNVIVELNHKNQIVWQWSVAQHIDVATANVNWRDQYPDVIHMNSIEYDGNGGIIFSARHLDAIYRIDMATGGITWKLGGSPTPQTLKVVGDQYLDAGGQLFSGQHDARLQPDESLTLHDNGSRANRAPRALRFTIDMSTYTATEVEQVTDPRAPTSPYTGSVEKLPAGNWVADWGGGDFTTELSPQGVPQITITYPGYFSYRAAQVSASVNALRRGMDAMVPTLSGVPLPAPNPLAAANASTNVSTGAASPASHHRGRLGRGQRRAKVEGANHRGWRAGTFGPA